MSIAAFMLRWIVLASLCLLQLTARQDFFVRSESIDIHFDNKESGFFLKQAPYPPSPAQNGLPPPLSEGDKSPPRQPAVSPATGYFTTNIADVSKGGGGGLSKKINVLDDKVISVDKFTVFDSNAEQSIAIKVNYGPFSNKQTIPSPFTVPEVSLGYFNNATNGFEEEVAPGGNGARNVQRLATTNALDLSVHLVQNQIPRDNPVLRVLFHIGSSNTRRYSKQKLCIILQVSLGSKTLTTSCSPDNEDGVCLAQVTIPATWWTPLPNLPWKKHVKYPLRHVKVSYSVLETKLRTQALGERNQFGPSVESENSRTSSEESPRRRSRSSEARESNRVVDYDGMVNDGEYDGSESDGDGRNERNDRGNGEDQDEDDDDDGEEDDKDEESKENFNTSSERTTQSSTLDSRTPHTHRINDHTFETNTPSARNRTDEPTTRRIETSTRNSRGQESVIERSNKPDSQIADTTNEPTEPQTPRILNREMLLERTTRAQVAQQQQQKDQKNTENDSLPNKRNGAFQIPSLQETVEKHGPGILYSPENLHNSDNVHNQPGESLQNPPLGALDENQCLGHLSERVQIRPITALGSVPLVHARVSYKEYYLDRNLIVLISHQPLYPLSRVHIPVFVYKQNVNAFVLRCRVKSALRIISVENSNALHWNLSADISAKSSSATVTARRINTGTDTLYERDEARDPSLGEVLSFLIEVVEESSTELWDEGKLVWTVKYPPESASSRVSSVGNSQRAPQLSYENVFSRYADGAGFINPAVVNRKQAPQFGDVPSGGGLARNPRQSNSQAHLRNGKRRDVAMANTGDDLKNRKVTAKFQIHKDDIYAVLPISKSWQILNTAVLSGRQISQPMKVFIVSQAGKIADVTLQSSCTSEDESVLKVSSSCSSVYVDGTEMRGSSNASILVRYDSYSGLAQFTIWMPEFPLDIAVGDNKLSQIKGWKISNDEVHYSNKFQKKRRSVSTINSDTAAPVINMDEMITEDNDLNSNGPSGAAHQNQCRYKYQQTQVQVYARFVAPDHDTGRMRYLVSRRTSLRITDLVAPLLRPADPRIASLHNNILFGRSAGRTELQVISPVSGRVIGAREVRVANDKVSPTHLSVKIVSGLQLNITSDSAIENGYVAETSVTRRLTAQYQEGLLDIELSFSDNSRVSLRDIPAEDYLLIVDSLNPQIVAFAPMRLGSKHPRVIAVGEGKGELLRVAFLQPDTCRPGGPLKRTSPLLMATVKVDIDFQNFGDPNQLGGVGGQKSDFVQNDGSAGKFERKDFLSPDLRDILIGVPLKDSDSNDQPSVTAQRHSHHTLSINNLLGPRHPHHNANLAPLEIGMYVLLTSFCIAIIIFVLSCVMYASKFKPPPDDGNEPTLLRTAAGGGGFFSFSSSPFAKPHPPYNKPNGPAYNPVSTSEDNSHDWVWLGRTPLERTGGASQSPMSIHKASNMNRMRLVYNPACEENTDEVLCHDMVSRASSNSVSSGAANGTRLIDTNTYCKRDRDRCNVSPPVVPPHSNLSETDNGNTNLEDDEIKPPVPSRTESKRPHHHHHHRSSRHSGHKGEGKERVRSRSRNSRRSENGAHNISSGSSSDNNAEWRHSAGEGRYEINIDKNPMSRDILPVSREKSPMDRNIFPVRREKSPISRDIVPASREKSPISRDIFPVRRDKSPISRDIVPASREKSPKYRDIAPASRNIFPAGRDQSPKDRDIVPVGRDRSPMDRETFLSREREMLSVREFLDSDVDGRDFMPPQGEILARGRNQVVDIGLVEAVPKYANAEVHNTDSYEGYRGHANIIGNPLFSNALANYNVDDDDDEIDLSDDLEDDDDDFSDDQGNHSFGNVANAKYSEHLTNGNIKINEIEKIDNGGKYSNLGEELKCVRPRPLDPSPSRKEGSPDFSRISPELIRSHMLASPELSRRLAPVRVGRDVTPSPDSNESSRSSPNVRSSPGMSAFSRAVPKEIEFSRTPPNATSPIENRLANYRISPEDDLKLSDMLKRKPHRKGHAKKASLSNFKGIDYDRMFDPAFATTPIENPCIEEFDEERRGKVDENLNQPDEALAEIQDNLGTSNYFEIMKYFNNLKESNA